MKRRTFLSVSAKAPLVLAAVPVVAYGGAKAFDAGGFAPPTEARAFLEGSNG